MSLHKRRKVTRHPGNKTHGRGRKNRTRGLGNRGGKGMSGTGKRGDQKKTLVIHLYGNDYFGTVRRGAGLREKKKMLSISLQTIIHQLPRFLKEGVAKESKGSYELDLKSYKIIGDDAHGMKLTIHARAASAGANAAVAKEGGSIILPSN